MIMRDRRRIEATFEASALTKFEGKKLVLDADEDTSISAATDDQVDVEIAGANDFQLTANTATLAAGSSLVLGGAGCALDLTGQADALVLDDDGDTTISAPTDDQIDVEISGADDFTFTAGSFNVLDGSLVSIQGGGSGTGDVVARIGGTATEGLEIKVYEETISPAAVETDVLNAPAGAVLLSVQTNVESALTAGGTSVTMSIGINGNVDKYGTHDSDSLAKNQKISTIPDWAVLSSAEQIVVAAAATGGGSAGDSAFSAGTVRVRIVYAVPNDLDDAA